MSTLIKTAHVQFSAKMGTYTTMLQCSAGDFTQRYKGDVSDPSTLTCFPNLEDAALTVSQKPLINFVVLASRASDGITTPSTVDWYFGSTKLIFGSDNITTAATYQGVFERVLPNGSGTFHGLRILKNLPGYTSGMSQAIKAVGTVTLGNATDTLQAVYMVDIREATDSNANIVTIHAVNPSQGFTITSKGGTVQLGVTALREGLTQVTTGLTYEWYKLTGGTDVWTKIVNTAGAETVSADGKTLTVHEADILVQGIYKVIVKEGTVDFGQDIEKVVDASDAYDMTFAYNPPTAAIEEDSNASVKITPTVISRKTGQAITPAVTSFDFSAMDPAGNVLGTAIAKSDYTVTYAMAAQSSAGVDVAVSCNI